MNKRTCLPKGTNCGKQLHKIIRIPCFLILLTCMESLRGFVHFPCNKSEIPLLLFCQAQPRGGERGEWRVESSCGFCKPWSLPKVYLLHSLKLTNIAPIFFWMVFFRLYPPFGEPTTHGIFHGIFMVSFRFRFR